MVITALKSSNLRAAGYDAWTSTLTIEFHSGAAYEYLNVPPEVYDRLISATSPGQFHHLHIKDRFRFRRSV